MTSITCMPVEACMLCHQKQSGPLSQRRLSGGGEDTSVGLWVLGYRIPYLDDRRLGVHHREGPCPDNFIGISDMG